MGKEFKIYRLVIAQFKVLLLSWCLWHAVIHLTAKINSSITAGDVHSHQWVRALNFALGCVWKWRQRKSWLSKFKTKRISGYPNIRIQSQYKVIVSSWWSRFQWTVPFVWLLQFWHFPLFKKKNTIKKSALPLLFMQFSFVHYEVPCSCLASWGETA